MPLCTRLIRCIVYNLRRVDFVCAGPICSLNKFRSGPSESDMASLIRPEAVLTAAVLGKFNEPPSDAHTLTPQSDRKFATSLIDARFFLRPIYLAKITRPSVCKLIMSPAANRSPQKRYVYRIYTRIRTYTRNRTQMPVTKLLLPI